MDKSLLEELIEKQESKIRSVDEGIFHRVRPFYDLTDKENKAYLEYSRNESLEILKNLKQALTMKNDDKKSLFEDLIKQEEENILILDNQILNKFKTYAYLSDERNEDFLEYKRREALEILNNYKGILAEMLVELFGNDYE